MPIPEYPNFKSLTIDDLDSLNHYLHKYNPQACEFAPANLFIWQDFDHPKATLINNNLCVLITPPNEPPFFLEPIGRNKIEETIDICLKDTGKLGRVSEEFLFRLELEQYKAVCTRNQFDYVYGTKTLAELKGRKFDGKRNHIKNFIKRHQNYQYLPLTSNHKTQAMKLFEDWFAQRKESRHFPKLAYTSQKGALEKTFEYYDQLKMQGGAIYLDNEIKGFMIGSPLNRETISAHFQYGHPSLRGIFQILLREACKQTFSNYKCINLEQDLGIPGLRKAKLSYQPKKIEKKFEIINARGL